MDHNVNEYYRNAKKEPPVLPSLKPFTRRAWKRWHTKTAPPRYFNKTRARMHVPHLDVFLCFHSHVHHVGQVSLAGTKPSKPLNPRGMTAVSTKQMTPRLRSLLDPAFLPAFLSHPRHETPRFFVPAKRRKSRAKQKVVLVWFYLGQPGLHSIELQAKRRDKKQHTKKEKRRLFRHVRASERMQYVQPFSRLNMT